jgi:hypothetical protein
VAATVTVGSGPAAAKEAAGIAGRRDVDLVYVSSTRVDVYRELVRLLPGVPVVGTSAVLLPDVARGVPAGGKAYATSPAMDAATSAPRFTKAWRAANPKVSGPPPYALEAYYATQTFVEAIRRAIVVPAPGTIVSPPTRGDILKQLPVAPLRTEDLYGLTFDDHGDNASGLVSVHEARGGAWHFSSQMQFAG